MFDLLTNLLSFVSFNARGLRSHVKRKALFLFAKGFKTDLCFIQEAHSTIEDAKHSEVIQYGLHMDLNTWLEC